MQLFFKFMFILRIDSLEIWRSASLDLRPVIVRALLVGISSV